MNDLRALKSELRRELRSEAGRFSAAERAAASIQICQRLKEQPVWKKARAILFFSPLPEEPDIHPLLEEAFAEGKAAALPRYSTEQGRYEACPISDLNRELQIGAFGIREPSRTCPVFDLKKLDLALVPGVGFALDGLRLGRGKGHYDQLLAEIAGFKCGIAFDWQLAVEVPAEPHDIRLDGILTPTRWHEVAVWRRV